MKTDGISRSTANNPPVAISAPPLQLPPNCLNPATEINSRLDTQVEVRVYPCNNNNDADPPKKKFTRDRSKEASPVQTGTFNMPLGS